MLKKLVFNITPQTNVRATQGDRILFRIPREKLKPQGLKRLLRLEKYNEYKIDIAEIARHKNFVLPEQGLHIIFYFPTPKTWKEYKKKEMHMKLHQSKPDVDNCLKAIFDGLMSEDKHIADVRATKRWVNQEDGYIEFIVNIPEFPSNDVLI